MIAEIINIGTELIIGEAINLNAQKLGRWLFENGIYLKYATIVQDTKRDIYEALETAAKRVRFVITTGGLGTDENDITKKALAEFLNLQLIYDENLLQKINNSQEKSTNYSVSLIPKGAQIFENREKNHYGILLENGRNIFLALPGNPEDVEYIFTHSFIPFLNKRFDITNVVKFRTLKIIGLSDAEIKSRLAPLLSQANPKIYILSDGRMVRIVISVNARDNNSANIILDNFEDKIHEQIDSDIICCIDEEQIEDIVVSLLALKRYTISTAESCTGGMLASFLTNISGVSKYFKGGIVAYSNESKIKFLSIPEDVLIKYGAVSEETVKMMAVNVKKQFATNVGIAISGFAGPGGGTEGKPVGTVCVGIAVNDKIKTFTFHFAGNRKIVRQRSTLMSLDLLRLLLIKDE